MSVNFTSVKNIRILSVNNPDRPHFPEFQHSQEKDICVIRLECQLTDKDFEYFKEVTDKSDTFKKSSTPFIENDILHIDIGAREEKNQYNVFLNEIQVPQDERAIFGIVTFLCALTKLIKEGNLNHSKLNKFLDIINLACDRVGKRALKRVL